MDAAAEEVGAGGARSNPGFRWSPRGSAFRPYGAAKRAAAAVADVVRRPAGADGPRLIVKKPLADELSEFAEEYRLKVPMALTHCRVQSVGLESFNGCKIIISILGCEDLKCAANSMTLLIKSAGARQNLKCAANSILLRIELAGD